MSGHLIHIGFPKTGSVFLREWFAAHPQLAYLPSQFAGFRTVYDLVREGVVPNPEIRFRVTSSESFAMPQPRAGEPAELLTWSLESSVPVAQATVCNILGDLFPSAHVLIVTRGFRSLMPSIYSQYVRVGGVAPFDEFCLLMLRDAMSGEGSWNYDRVIGDYRRAFGKDRVVVMPFELLRDDCDGFLRKLEERLGLDPSPAPTGRRNVSLSGHEMYWYPRISRLVARIDSVPGVRRAYVRGLFRGWLRGPVSLLRFHSQDGASAYENVPGDLLEAFNGSTESLRELPLYDRYATDYLL